MNPEEAYPGNILKESVRGRVPGHPVGGTEEHPTPKAPPGPKGRVSSDPRGLSQDANQGCQVGLCAAEAHSGIIVNDLVRVRVPGQPAGVTKGVPMFPCAAVKEREYVKFAGSRPCERNMCSAKSS